MSSDDEKTTSLSVKLDGNLLQITYNRARKTTDNSYEIDITSVSEGTIFNTGFKLYSYRLKNKILLTEKVSEHETLIVFSENDVVKFYRHTDDRTHPLTRLINVKSKTFLHLTKRGIRLNYICFIQNPYNISVKSSYLSIGEDFRKRRDYLICKSFPSKKQLLTRCMFTDYIPLPPLLQGEPNINEKIGVSIDIDGSEELAHLYLTKGSKRLEAKGRKWFYYALARTRVGGYSISIRRNGSGGLTLVRRLLEDIEKTPRFRFYESGIISFLLYYLAHLSRHFSKNTVNIYYEKNANQAEEGTIDLFRKARDNATSKNYFIINKWSKDFPSIKDEKDVVPNFTLKSYWLLYRANNFIATETFGHVNIGRSDNKYIRKAPFSERFIFLQHGVTYMKRHEKNTSFIKNREFEPAYMIVNSKKERDIVSTMLDLEEERLLNTGMLIFDGIDYGHITQKSPDIVTIMLTWKPYEEHLKDATKSTYYKTVVSLYNMLEPLVGKDNLRIVIHPKFKEHMAKTDMGETMWQGAISDVLTDTKLLITDYSSVCYNVFYQGGAVIYYQPDLELYEQSNGRLIPSNDEYTGYRMFDEPVINKLLEDNINDGVIDMSKLRTKKHIDNYLSINEHHDGENVDRIYDRFKKAHII